MTSVFEIIGGKALSGSIEVQGAKNEALQVLCAVMLTNKPVRIKNIPEILDVKNLIKLLERIGVEVFQNNFDDYTFTANNISLDILKKEDFLKQGASLRGSVMILGPLLARLHYACIPTPGGDKIGRRRLDTHFFGLQALGGIFSYDPNKNLYEIQTKNGLKGAHIILEEPSVTGTANIVMAAVLAKGKTVLYNAACEPYLQQLCKMLNGMGAKISGIGSNLLEIEGVDELSGTEHTLLPDMIEVGSFIGLAAMTKSEILIENVSWENLGNIPFFFKKLGIEILREGPHLRVTKQDLYQVQTFVDGSILTLSDGPWPMLTPDLLSILLVVAIQAKGSVLIHQEMFESRLFFVDKLIDMGAQIILCDPHRATVIGLDRNSNLRGITMVSPDIRAGVSLLIAALSAEGKSTIQNIEQIDRGYQNIEQRLQKLGAQIQRKSL